jgi:hypothetical protein
MADPRTPAAAWYVRASRSALLVTAAGVVLALLAAWPWTGFASTFGHWAQRPEPRLLLPLAGFVAAATLLAGRWRWWGRLVAAGCLAAAWSSFRVLTMGDGHWWRDAAANGTVTFAEPLASHLNILLFRLGGAEALEWCPPVFGFLATQAWLWATDDVVARLPRPVLGRCLAALLWVSSGVHIAFFHRYVEQTQIGVPLLLLGIVWLQRWSHAVDAAPARGRVSSRDFARGAAALLLATLLHLMYVGMFVAAVGAAWLVGLRHGSRASLVRLLAVVGAVVAAAAATVLLFRLGPFTPFAGSVAGGADHAWLTPWTGADGSWTGQGAMLSPQHLALVAFLLWLGAPAVVPFALAVLRPGSRARTEAALAPVAAGCAWIAFVATFGFDLGWPTDADLMLAMSVALSWLVASWLLPALAGAGAATRALGIAGLLLAVASTWSVLTPLVRPVGTNVSQANSAQAALQLGGNEPFVGPGPFRVPAADGDIIDLRASGPAGAVFCVFQGAPAPAHEGQPYGGVYDIRFPKLEPPWLVHGGSFDASGQAVVPFVVRPLPDGAWPGVQMIVFGLPAPRTTATSAAIYFERR